MPNSLITIGKSGALAARSALDVTAQNIANVNNEGYARRTVGLEEVGSKAGLGWDATTSLSGVRVASINRTTSAFLQSEARRTGSDVQRASAELTGLRSAENAIEQAGIFPAITEFEASLVRLSADPLNPSLRAAVIAQTDTLVQTFNLAAGELQTAGEGAFAAASDGVRQVNQIAEELTRTNAALVRVQTGSSNQAVLLDQRDALLARLADHSGISVAFGDKGQTTVRLGDASGPALVAGTQLQELEVAQAADGTLSYTLGGLGVALASGGLAGHAQGAQAITDTRTRLDDIAVSFIAQVNTAQTSGTTPDGAAGQPLLAGADAASLSLLTRDGAALATAPAGAPSGSRDNANLQNLRDVLATSGPAGRTDALLFSLSSTIDSRSTTRDALGTIAETAATALAAETGVDLDTEATNLLRYQQAFQASGRVIQVASDLFDTLLGIR